MPVRQSVSARSVWTGEGLIGAVVGLALPLIGVVTQAGFPMLIDVFVHALPALSLFGATGAVLSTTLVWLAKRAEKRELEAGEREIARLEAGSS